MTHYQLSLYADKLKTSLWGRRPIPYAVVTLIEDDDGSPSSTQELGRTEVYCEPTTTPDWCTGMKLELDPSETFGFRVQIYDSSSGPRADRIVAQANFEAHEIFQSPGHVQRKEDSTGSQ